ncbi:MAG TPA: hypothetical protein V6C91_11560 [Coleofasciculaceae cyanobacterium]
MKSQLKPKLQETFMKKRDDIVQKFSTFLSFSTSNRGQNLKWQVDPELERYMKRLTDSEPEAKAEFWARHFLKILRGVSSVKTSREAENEEDTGNPDPPIRSRENEENSPEMLSSISPSPLFLEVSGSFGVSPSRAGRHLSAYLQEACLWAAKKNYQKFKFFRHKYPLEELFQIANSAANPPQKLLKNFKFDYPKTNIEGYARTAITRYIGNTIYQQDLEAKRDKFSAYGLLKDLTAKELREALVLQGINPSQIDLYCLAWKCFDEIYQSNDSRGSHSLTSPDQEQLKQISCCYNQRLHQFDLTAVPASAEKIQEILSICIQAARDRRTHRFFSVEDFDNISNLMPTPLDSLINEEAWEQVELLVSSLFSAMPERGQTMLKLWQGLSLTQTEIAAVLQSRHPELKKQYQVARQLGKYTRDLFKDFANQLKSIYPEMCFSDEQYIEYLKNYLDDYLQIFCKDMLCSSLDDVASKWVDRDKFFIIINDFRLKRNQSKESLNSSTKQLMDAKQKLANLFKRELEFNMDILQESLDLVDHKINQFLDECLTSKSLN